MVTPSRSGSAFGSLPAFGRGSSSSAPSSTMPLGVTTRWPCEAAVMIGIGRGHAHLVVEGAEHELADVEGSALGEEGLDAQILVDALHPAVVDDAAGIDLQAAEGDALALELRLDSTPALLRSPDGVGADLAQVGGHLVAEHLLQAEAEQVGCIAAVRAREDVAAEARRAARPAVAGGAAVGQARGERRVAVDVEADPVVGAGAEALRQRELALEDLAAAPDRAERIARDDVAARIPACSGRRAPLRPAARGISGCLRSRRWGSG